jgi:ATP-dependent helicase HrpA
VDIAQQLATHIESVLPKLHQNQKQIRALGLSAIYAKEDIDQQLNWLFCTATLSRISLDRISQYPRLVRGVEIRLEKLASQVSKDQQYIQEIQGFLQPVPSPQDQLLSEELAEAIDNFHWTVEEYRISLFAQQLKTRVPVSAKRLQKQWLEIDDQLRRFTL